VAVAEGRFVLYPRIEAPLQPGDYRFRASQALTATEHDAQSLPVAELRTHVTVRAPRYALPPDQLLSTFPPAGSEGDYGLRLPQVVIRRRTLPWERSVQDGVAPEVPWLALVVIAEGEAQLRLNQPVAQCVTAGVSLPGVAESELGNCLEIRKSIVDQIFPAQAEVSLLAHAREVDIHDTELMMGDDDGFLAVVVANRLPLPGRDADGNAAPITYLACLVNLEGQFLDLRSRAAKPVFRTPYPVKSTDLTLSQAPASPTGAIGPAIGLPEAGPTPYDAPSAGVATGAATDVYADMALDFASAPVSGYIAGHSVTVDPTMRFPVLLHWSFTSFGNATFRSLMEGLDSGLLGTVGTLDPMQRSGRPPLEVVETGHVGLIHRTRRGDPVRSWYRGPFVAHPMAQAPTSRLPLAHAADQLRIVVPDGREDISLAAAFEIGRMLALARPSMVAALMRWRQTGYQAGRRRVMWESLAPFLDAVLGAGEHRIDSRLGVLLGRGLVEAVVIRPQDLLGEPRPKIEAGRPLDVTGTVEQVLARGFGLDSGLFGGDPATVLDRLRTSPVIEAGESAPGDLDEALATTLAQQLQDLQFEGGSR
jgi:hypothetical protein